MLIPYMLVAHFNRVDLSGNYTAETLPKRVYLSLDDRALFLPAMTWFYYYYYQDVERLRDDVTAVKVWDLLAHDAPAMLTPRRYPDLRLPLPAAYHFKSYENISEYIGEFLRINHPNRPILLEHNTPFFELTAILGDFQPHRNAVLKFAPGNAESDGLAAWRDLGGLLEDELQRPGIGRSRHWTELPGFWLSSLALYARETGRYPLEAKVIQVLFTFFGLHRPEWELRWLENHLHMQKPEEAQAVLHTLEARWPDRFETWMGRGAMARHTGQAQPAVAAFAEAARRRPESIRPYLDQAAVWVQSGQPAQAQKALTLARPRIANLLEWQAWKRMEAALRG